MKENKIKMARYLRQEQTPAENLLWEVLRNRQFENLKFRRQHPLKEYIVDFYCDELELIIELDGGYHLEKEQKEKDEQRDLHLRFLGYRILRYPNKKAANGIKEIYNDILNIKKETPKHFKQAKIIKEETKKTPSQRERAGLRDLDMGKTILSTKKLLPNQRELLLNSGVSFVEYSAIEITPLSFEIPQHIENAIFTSQNAVHVFLKNLKSSPFSAGEGLGMRVFCVGEKTKVLLEENGLNVVENEKKSEDLARFIAKNYKNESFVFFCGNRRRDELPTHLANEKIQSSEVITYKTVLKNRKFDQKWDGILFFSPSGVESYISENIDNTKGIAFCIGETTATEAKKYFSNISIANTTSVESVIVKAVKTLTQ